MATYDHVQLELEPRKLSPEEIKDPERVIHQFFDYAHLPEVRAHLWDWLKSTVTGDFNSLSLHERGNLLYFFEQVEKLIEAAHIIHQQSKKN
jgi:hypothetical protein